MSGIWGGQTALDLYLQEQGITTLFFAGVNADQVSFRSDPSRRPSAQLTGTWNIGGQCVLGTLVDAYFRGYDCILVEDCVATTSPQGALESVVYNAGGVRPFPCSIAVSRRGSIPLTGRNRATASLRPPKGSSRPRLVPEERILRARTFRRRDEKGSKVGHICGYRREGRNLGYSCNV